MPAQAETPFEKNLEEQLHATLSLVNEGHNHKVILVAVIAYEDDPEKGGICRVVNGDVTRGDIMRFIEGLEREKQRILNVLATSAT